LPELIKRLTIAVKDLEPVELWISDIDLLIVAHCQAGVVAGFGKSNLVPKMSPELQDLNPIISGIEYHDFVSGRDKMGWISPPRLPKRATTCPFLSSITTMCRGGSQT